MASKYVDTTSIMQVIGCVYNNPQLLDFTDKYTITPEINPTTVLGCWVINHNFKGYKSKDKIGVDGSLRMNFIALYLELFTRFMN